MTLLQHLSRARRTSPIRPIEVLLAGILTPTVIETKIWLIGQDRNGLRRNSISLIGFHPIRSDNYFFPTNALWYTGHASPPTIALAYGRAADDRTPGLRVIAAATALLQYWRYRKCMEHLISYRTYEGFAPE